MQNTMFLNLTKRWLYALALLPALVFSASNTKSSITTLGNFFVDYILKVNSLGECKPCEMNYAQPSYLGAQETCSTSSSYTSSVNIVKIIAKLKGNCVVIDHDSLDQAGIYYLKSVKDLVNQTLLSINDLSQHQEVISLVKIDLVQTHEKYPLNQKNSAIDPSFLKNFRLLHIEVSSFEHIEILKQILDFAKSQHTLISLDLRNSLYVKKYKDEILNIIPKYVDLVFATESEIFELTHLYPQEACDFIASFCNVAVITMGEKGCWAKNSQIKLYTPASGIKSNNPIIEEDYFISGFLYAFLEERSLQVCTWLGAYLASKVSGNTPEQMPDGIWNEIQALLKKSQSQGLAFSSW